MFITITITIIIIAMAYFIGNAMQDTFQQEWRQQVFSTIVGIAFIAIITAIFIIAYSLILLYYD